MAEVCLLGSSRGNCLELTYRAPVKRNQYFSSSLANSTTVLKQLTALHISWPCLGGTTQMFLKAKQLSCFHCLLQQSSSGQKGFKGMNVFIFLSVYLYLQVMNIEEYMTRNWERNVFQDLKVKYFIQGKPELLMMERTDGQQSYMLCLRYTAAKEN